MVFPIACSRRIIMSQTEIIRVALLMRPFGWASTNLRPAAFTIEMRPSGLENSAVKTTCLITREVSKALSREPRTWLLRHLFRSRTYWRVISTDAGDVLRAHQRVTGHLYYLSLAPSTLSVLSWNVHIVIHWMNDTLIRFRATDTMHVTAIRPGPRFFRLRIHRPFRLRSIPAWVCVSDGGYTQDFLLVYSPKVVSPL